MDHIERTPSKIPVLISYSVEKTLRKKFDAKSRSENKEKRSSNPCKTRKSKPEKFCSALITHIQCLPSPQPDVDNTNQITFYELNNLTNVEDL